MRRSSAPGGSATAGWPFFWVSPRRFGEATGRIRQVAAEAGRRPVRWRHALQLWVGFGAPRAHARERVSRTMQEAYSMPFERFERYVPYGPPEAVAAALVPYLEVGCRCFDVVPEGESLEAMDAIVEVKALLSSQLLHERPALARSR
jgi:alkanesulfonate monooxygenase SsuD/methylene tetrahydromethanopterin reductase-like flavin-dependent oxidoreductase (luciferase family)